MYRDQQEALHARVEALEAELEAERAAGVAAEARFRAAEARARATEARATERRLGGAAPALGWWGRPWVVMAVSLLAASSLYLLTREGLRRSAGECPYGDQRLVLRVMEQHRADLEGCYRTAVGPQQRVSREAEVRLTVQPSGEVSVTTVHGIEPFHQGLASCLQGRSRDLVFPPLSRGRAVTVRLALIRPD